MLKLVRHKPNKMSIQKQMLQELEHKKIFEQAKNYAYEYLDKIEEIDIYPSDETLTKLKNGQTEYEFIGITSNGIDCIYFIYEKVTLL